MPAICQPCTEETPAYMVGVFTLEVQRSGEILRNVGNLAVGNVRERTTVFEGCPADGSSPDRRHRYQVRDGIDVVCTMEEITCENLRMWLEGPVVNTPSAQRIQQQHVQQKSEFRLVLTRAFCDDSVLTWVIYRATIVAPYDLLFSPSNVSGNQVTFRALRDPDHPNSPYGYVEIVPATCAVS